MKDKSVDKTYQYMIRQEKMTREMREGGMDGL